MNPLSSLYYIFHDSRKTIGLVILMILELTIYLGTLIFMNCFENTYDISGNTYFAVFNQNADYASVESFNKLRDRIAMDDRMDYIECNRKGKYSWNTIFNNVSEKNFIVFSSVENFEKYCSKEDICCDTSVLKDGSVIMSSFLADNKGVSVGDTIDEKVFSGMKGSFSFDLAIEEKSYKAYIIDYSIENEMLMIYPSDEKEKDIGNIAKDYIDKDENGITFADSMDSWDDISYYSCIIFAVDMVFYSVILSIMINAVFVGSYQTRSFEFALYKAVGIRKRRIVGKIISEIVCIQLLALILGGMILFVFLYLFNNLVLYPKGKYISYCNRDAVYFLRTVILMVNIPLIISRSIQVKHVKIRNF